MTNTPETIKILSLNVGRSSSAQEIALQLSFEKGIDILLVQEPYIYKDLSRKLTRKHQSFECFSPVDDWRVRPRVLSYTRKDNGLIYSQIRPVCQGSGSADVLFLTFKTPKSPHTLLINTYNAPPGAINPNVGLEFLMSLPFSNFASKTIITGDFNLHHENWQPSYPGSASPLADKFTRWLDTRDFTLISDVDVPTHNRGNVLDLCFASAQLVASGINSSVQRDLDMTSDHKPLLITITSHSYRLAAIPRPRFATIDENTFTSLLNLQLQGMLPLVEKTHQQIDTYAEALVHILYSSFAGSAMHSLPHNKGQPWWNQVCRDAKKRYKNVCRLGPPSRTDKKAFRKVVREAKRSFYLKKLADASVAKDVFDIAKWHKSKGNFRTPPLIDPLNLTAPPAQSLESKRNILINNLLKNQSGTEDIPFSTPTVAPTSLPFPRLTETEVSSAILRAGNTTPGKDGISTALLRLAWPHISSIILNLFQSCIDAGYHPQCFRTAILAIIEKPNKVDMSSPRSYRPIALLSVLGKGLERLIAKRMSWISIRHRLIGRQQFGALPLRSSTDLTTCLTHDVESSLAKGLTATMATLDIKGAFDAILPGRLVLRLREQGWPTQLCDWVSSFVSERRVCIRLDGEVGPARKIECGLPQGSPISPILFMLFISPLFKLDGLQKSFGYADDVSIIETSSSLDENVKNIGSSINKALAWGETQGLKFDKDKSEIIHFSRKRKDKNYNPGVVTNEFRIDVNRKNPYIKWLGIHFDKTLSFKYHVRIQTSKALKVVNAFRCLGNTSRGVLPRLSRQAVTACVLPIAHFGAETWWPGKTRKQRNKIVSNRVGEHTRLIEKVYTAAARAILPVFRTTPTAALLRESGLSTAEIALDTISRRAAIRTRRLDPYHPLRCRAHKPTQHNIGTRFSRTLFELPISEKVDPLRIPPWEMQTAEKSLLWNNGSNFNPRASISENFSTFLGTINQSDILVYSDGSKLTNGNTGWGYVIFQIGRRVCSGSGPLGNTIEVQDAEVHATLHGIRAALSLPSARFANNLWLFLDNKGVAKMLLKSSPVRSSQSLYTEFWELEKKWGSRNRLPHIQEGQVKIHWVPSHSGIIGNEIADLEAKKAAAISIPEPQLDRSFASLEKWHQARVISDRERWWNKQAPQSYTRLEIRSAPLLPKELLLSRKQLGRLIAARTGHGDFAAYHTRLKHTEAKIQCRCGSLKTPLHFFFCRILRRRGYRPEGNIHVLVPRLLGTAEGAVILTKWLSSTKFFEEICP